MSEELITQIEGLPFLWALGKPCLCLCLPGEGGGMGGHFGPHLIMWRRVGFWITLILISRGTGD